MEERRILTLDDLSKEASGYIEFAANWYVTQYISTLEIEKKWCKFFEKLGIFRQVDEFVSGEGRKHYHYELTGFGWKLINDAEEARILAHKRWLSNPRNFPPNVSLLWDDAPIKRAEMPKAVNASSAYKQPTGAIQPGYTSPKVISAQAKLEAWNAKVSGKTKR